MYIYFRKFIHVAIGTVFGRQPCSFIMSTADGMRTLEANAAYAEEMINFLKSEVAALRGLASQENVGKRMIALQVENEQLRQEVEALKTQLTMAEIHNGVKQVFLPSSVPAVSVKTEPLSLFEASDEKENTPPRVENKAHGTSEKKSDKKEQKKKDKAPAKADGKKGGAGGGSEEELPIDVGRLDFRVGRIVSCELHPDAESLYVEQVDVGEEKLRTVVSGLVKFVPVEQMRGRLAVLLCNLKPAKMRGVTSEAMVMCASTPEKVEVLSPPSGSVPGDLVECEGYVRKPDSILNPKKKIFETVAPDLKTDENRVATFKGVPFTVPGKGVVVAETLTGVQVK